MAKNKKRSKVIKKRKPAKEISNPFEMRINKQKHKILGRKTKNDHGMPGISRNKAIKKRKETLLREYKLKNKSNSYVDRRFGQDEDGNSEDKAAIRFAIERKKSKSSVYNLNDDEELTHLGRSIGEMDKFDDPDTDTEDDERLESDFVKKAHFGGGILTKKDNEESEKSRKAIMEEIIADRIQRKQERQKVKEDNMDLTDKLDGTWKDIQKLMINLKQFGTSYEPEEEPQRDDYDIKVQELKFEAKGKATDKLKTDEEIAHEERQKLEKLELERLERMKGGNRKLNLKPTHFSADGLDDDFKLESGFDDQKPEFIPSKRLRDPMIYNTVYDDDGEKSEGDDNDDVGNSESDDDNDDGVKSEGDDDDGDDGVKSEGDDNDDGVKSEDNDDSDDSYADILTDDEEAGKSEADDEKVSEKNSILKKDKPQSIPFVIECPNSFDDFFKLVSNCSSIEIAIIIDRIIKCNHPSLSSDNKSKLESLFAFILQFIDEICNSNEIELTIIDNLTINCQNLLLMSTLPMSKMLLKVIAEKRDEFLAGTKGTFKTGLSTLIYLKLVSIFYPTSDYQHSIVTPSMIFMSQMISIGKINSPIDIIKGLYVSSLFYEYVSVSKRLIPEVIHFLNKIVELFEKNLIGTDIDYDNVKPNYSKFSIKMFKLDENLTANDLIGQILTLTLNLIKKFATLYEDSPSFSELFASIKNSLTSLTIKYFESEIELVISQLSVCSIKSFIRKDNRKPPTLKLYEPRIRENFDGKKKHCGSQKKLEQQKLVHKYKREMKGAMREIRRDNHFIASEKLNEQLGKDAERKEKLKRLYHDLASQEGDFKKMKKK